MTTQEQLIELNERLRNTTKKELEEILESEVINFADETALYSLEITLNQLNELLREIVKRRLKQVMESVDNTSLHFNIEWDDYNER